MRRRYVRLGVTVLTGMILATAATACGDEDDGGGSKAASDVDLYYSLYDRQVAFFRGCVDGVETEAEKQGVNLNVEVSGLDPTKQIQQLETAILQQPDGIIVTAIDATAVEPTLQKASEAGIPVIGVCDDYGAIHRGDSGPGRVSYIGQDMELIGKQKAEYVYENLAAKGQLDGAKVAAIYGVRGVPFDIATRAGMQSVIDQHPEAEFVEGPYAGEYSAPAGLEAAQNVIAANPDIDALICDQSDTCLGAVQAIEEAGIDPDDILVSSTDGQQAELDAVAEGQIDYTTVYCAFDEGALAVQQMADLVVRGEAPPEHTIDLGFGVNSSAVDPLKTENVDSQTVSKDVNSVDQPCDSPLFDVANEEPNVEELEAVGIDTSE